MAGILGPRMGLKPMAMAEPSAPPQVAERLRRTRDLVFGGLMIALGVLAPIAFHAVGWGGLVFLPMHLPVLIAGLLVSWRVALFVGLLTPIVSSVLTGMPPPLPMAPIMALELCGLAVAASLLRGAGVSVWLAGLGAVAVRIALRPVLFLLAVPLLGVEASFRDFVIVTLLQGWPGVVLQILVAPSLVALIEGQWSVASVATGGRSRSA